MPGSQEFSNNPKKRDKNWKGSRGIPNVFYRMPEKPLSRRVRRGKNWNWKQAAVIRNDLECMVKINLSSIDILRKQIES